MRNLPLRSNYPARDQERRWLVVARVGAPHGLRGWVKVWSLSGQPELLAGYGEFIWSRAPQPPAGGVDNQVSGPDWRPLRLVGNRLQGKALLCHFAGSTDRDAAAALTGGWLSVPESALQPLPEGEYYWYQLIGLRVLNQVGQELGVVKELMETGDHDVLVVAGDRTRYIPYARGQVVTEVAPEEGCIRVDWDADF